MTCNLENSQVSVGTEVVRWFNLEQQSGKRVKREDLLTQGHALVSKGGGGVL